MRLIVFYILFLLSNFAFAQSSYIELLKEGETEVEIGFHNFSKEKNELNNKGFEYELMNLFFDYVENKKQVTINRKFVHKESFKKVYEKVKNNELDFAYCFFSITNERKEEVHFSPSYMPNIEVLISNNSLPIVSDSNDFKKRFKGATIVYIPETIYEERALELKKAFPSLKLEAIKSSTQLIKKVNSTKDYFGFIELQQYFQFQNELTNVSRQNIFLIKREGYGFIFPMSSDWKPIVDLFFLEKHQEINDIIRKRFDGEMIKFIDEIQSSSSNDLNLMLLTKEKEIEEIKGLANKLLYDNEKLENHKNEAEKKELRRNLLVIIALFVIIGLIAFVAYRLKVRHNKEVLLKNEQLAIQKNIVEIKHTEIKDSINYAKRIQNALLQGEEYLNLMLPDHFIFFQPKDVVSGDFYWGKNFDKHYYLSITDCTGHGVPGGFMSVLGIAMLNEITRSKKNISPSDMLDVLRQKIILELAQNSERESNKDGMNTVVLKVNKETNHMRYAGAYHSILIIRDGKLIELKTDKEPIGFTYIMTPFTNHEYQLLKGDLVYLYSDGYADQFGGEKGKKFKSRNFKELLLSIHSKTMVEQKQIITKQFNIWKGKEEQVDDVTVLGMRI